MNEHETSAAIIAEMRSGQVPQHRHDRELLRYYADRLEAAHKREIEATAAKCCQLGRLAGYGASEIKHQQEPVGNAAKLPKTVDTRFDICQDIALVLKIGRDYQNKDGYRGAHYDTVKLLCDAIEYQQEQLKTKTEVGDVAKLREALSDACYAMFNFLKAQNGGYEEMASTLDKAKAALAAPARNCDVGTAEKQEVRFDAFVQDRRGGLDCTGKCPAHNGVDFGVVACVLQWAQMPYEEGGAK